jgi:hypothetical protein
MRVDKDVVPRDTRATGEAGAGHIDVHVTVVIRVLTDAEARIGEPLGYRVFENLLIQPARDRLRAEIFDQHTQALQAFQLGAGPRVERLRGAAGLWLRCVNKGNGPRGPVPPDVEMTVP